MMVRSLALSAALSCVLTLQGRGADRPAIDVPPLNAAVVKFCEDQIGKKIGDGECSALADEALSAAGARRARDFETADEAGGPVWGTPVERLDDALPGDVVQFQDVTLIVRNPNGGRWVRRYPQHTAIVARNRGGGTLDLYEQNVVTPGADATRRAQMRRRRTDFRGMVGGTVRIFRPAEQEADHEK